MSRSVRVTGAASDAAFVGGAALLFAASAAGTVAWCASMSGEGDMPMPGGWTMSMAWMRMPGQSWPGAAAAFLGMWTLMTVAMMLPSVAPAIRRCRRGRAAASVGYLAVWTALGAAIYPIGVALAELEMRADAASRAVPFAAGVVVLLAGATQFTAWKARHLACCREGAATSGAAWRDGARLGAHCVVSCTGPTAALLALGVMDVRAMAAVTAAITLERLARDGPRAARIVGALALTTGLVMIARALGVA